MDQVGQAPPGAAIARVRAAVARIGFRSMRTPLLAVALLAACASRPVVPAEAPRPVARASAPLAAQTAPWWKTAVFYEVFVRSFQDSNGDGVGDLPGLTARLDYLNDGNPASTTSLGVDALWLMPVFKSPSYHGYDVTDFQLIQPAYGTNEDLDRLVAEAHRRGLRVVVDLVLNHTSNQHPWFKESASAPTSPRRDWYVWSDTDPGWTQPWNSSATTWHQRNGAYYYGLFWGGMPDLNYRTPAVREEAKRVARYWLERGVDGFRLDAARHLIETGPGPGQSGNPETHAFWVEFAAAVHAAKPDAVLVGEVWSNTDDIAEYYGPPGKRELDLLFDFPLSDAIVKGIEAGDAGFVGATLREVQQTNPAGATDAPFLANHDQVRLATRLGGDRARLRLAAAVLLTLPGAPFLYYGEELGLENGPGSDDEWKRTPMPWDGTPQAGFTSGRPWHALAPGREAANVAAQASRPDSLLARYRSLLRARHASPALREGDLHLLRSPSEVLAFLRRSGAETVLVAHNFSAQAVDALLDVGAAGAEPILVDPGGAATRQGDGCKVSLPAKASGIWRVKR
jgi:alpha-amylase